MPIRDQAIAAFDAAQAARVADAQARLGEVLALPDGKPAVDPKALTVAHEDRDAGLFVFTDGDVALGVWPATGEVVLVGQDDGGAWVRRSGPLDTLAGLGRVLSEQEVTP